MFGIVEYFYRPIYDYFEGNDFLLTVGGFVFLKFITIWGVSLVYFLIDLYQWPEFVLKYKIQHGINTPVDGERLWKACKSAFLNTTVLNLSFVTLMYPLQRYCGSSADPDKIPYIWTAWIQLTICDVINEFGFYYSHRLFHWGPLYKNYHKIHHEWTAPVAITSMYSHPLEHLLSHNLPSDIGLALVGAHPVLMWYWAVNAMTVTVMHHGGYHFPFFDSPEFHDYHHLKFNVNYGSSFTDKIHGTDYYWAGSVEQKRHFTFYSLTKTIRDLIPDRPRHDDDQFAFVDDIVKEEKKIA